MRPTLFVTGALALALSGVAFAHGTGAGRSSARAPSSPAFTANDCEMLTIKSARSNCLRTAMHRENANAAMGMSSGTSGSGEVRGDSSMGGLPSPDLPQAFSGDPTDPTTFRDTPR